MNDLAVVINGLGVIVRIQRTIADGAIRPLNRIAHGLIPHGTGSSGASSAILGQFHW
jgi:hypothetical protein